MPAPFRLGFLTHVESAGEPRQIYRDTLELFAAADALGFDAVWVAQHHIASQTGCLPAPFPFLAAAAMRTRRVRLGTAVVVLPLEDPLRVAEDAAVVDALSAGRLELGVGSGGDAAEFAAFGRDIAERHARTTDGLVALRSALRGEPLGEQGQRLHPPAPALADRLWLSALSVGGAQHTAKHGAGLLLSRAAWASSGRTDEAQLPVVAAYHAAWRDVQPPRIGLSRGIYLAADKRAALEELREPLARWAARTPGVTAESTERLCERLFLFYGHPEEVAAELAGDRILPHADELILQFNPVTPTLDHALRMLDQIAHVVAPALGWRPQEGAAAQREARQD
jgi:alkanesulfonate monooxygenase SsuD/methylene tetrahydromethanopterin reductase-like flavin-dependent oxidoreductase (luciferase family)